jgi:predicted AAA+ superfamily ATPase
VADYAFVGEGGGGDEGADFYRGGEFFEELAVEGLVVVFARFDFAALNDIFPGPMAAGVDAFLRANTLAALAGGGGVAEDLPAEVLPWNTDWAGRLGPLSDFLRQNGAGTFARVLATHHAFVWRNGALIPAAGVDPVRLSDLVGYEAQRQIVIDNTSRFLDGKEANNILLYGDRGTGKSATVKAVCNDMAARGLCVIEVNKAALGDLPAITARLSGSSLKFVIFIDDLSFEKVDDAFTHIKGILEGGLEERPANIVVYATSNRRHLVSERFADRPSGGGISTGGNADVRAEDTMQEQLSLADRFGVTIVFGAPNQEQYLKIAQFIAEERGLLDPLTISDAELARFQADAVRWERWFNGRSPRSAKQFVQWLQSGAPFPWGP